MDTTFITIHDLSPDARILYCSESIVDILGYQPGQVYNRSCWDFFHPSELPIARARHGRGVELDKAAVLSYCRMRNSMGQWVGCEVVFTIVYDVMVGCTSIYQQGIKSERRAIESPAIRQIFSHSPKDPRYHMLSHLSSKFSSPPPRDLHEPRAAFFLNRYTRSLTIMYATNGLADILGISGDELKGKSFWYCIEENCLQDAIRCIEDAKSNDSIAYLRFRYRDPRKEEQEDEYQEQQSEAADTEMEGAESSPDEEDDQTIRASYDSDAQQRASRRDPSSVSLDSIRRDRTDSRNSGNSGTSSERSPYANSHEAIFDDSAARQSSASSVSNSPNRDTPRPSPAPGLELEAVISCTSDGLVVCIRQARPLLGLPATAASNPASYSASPWATSPSPTSPHHQYNSPAALTVAGATPITATTTTTTTTNNKLTIPAAAPQTAQAALLDTIRDCAVFAWALTGINGSLAYYSRGNPQAGGSPPAGLPIWAADATLAGAQAGFSRYAYADADRGAGEDGGAGHAVTGSGQRVTAGSGSGGGADGDEEMGT